MHKFKESKNQLIKDIYKAGECTDINDVQIALTAIQTIKDSLKNVRGPSRAVYIRERSLLKRAKKLFEKSVRPA